MHRLRKVLNETTGSFVRFDTAEVSGRIPMLKTLVSIILILGLMSPICLCGAVATESHAAATKATECHTDHHHSEHGEEQPHHAPDHKHSHSDFRVNASGAVALPAIPMMDLADWAVVLPDIELSVVDAPIWAKDWTSVPDFSRWKSPSATGVFLI